MQVLWGAPELNRSGASGNPDPSMYALWSTLATVMSTAYHQQTLDLLGQPFVPGHSHALADWANAHHVVVPASVREWYGLPNGQQILSRHSNGDHVYDPAMFQLHCEQTVPIIEFMLETQSCCRWGLWVDRSDDPPVVIQDLTQPSAWELCAERFTIFTYTQVFDWQYLLAEVAETRNEDQWSTLADPPGPAALAYLHEHYTPKPSTWTYPGMTVQRFSASEQRIIISTFGTKAADWALLGATETARWQLRHTMQHVWEQLGMWYEPFTEQ